LALVVLALKRLLMALLAVHHLLVQFLLQQVVVAVCTQAVAWQTLRLERLVVQAQAVMLTTLAALLELQQHHPQMPHIRLLLQQAEVLALLFMVMVAQVVL
jgi:hypothetical protein